MNIFKLLQEKVDTLNVDQKIFYNNLIDNNILQLCVPTGVGKGYLMMVDIFRRLTTTNEQIITIATHRLNLNTQHIDDLIGVLSEIITDVRFILVGSDKYNFNKHNTNKVIKKQLIKTKTSFNEMLISTLNNSVVIENINNNKANNKKTIIISTYHSMDKLKNVEIDTIYCDEAHMLASEKINSTFEKNYKVLNLKNKYFFTATPKDILNESDLFLMNNEVEFGKRVGMTFKEAYTKGYITKPKIHIAIPENYENWDVNNIKNKIKFILDSYNNNCRLIKENSSEPNTIQGKLLVKCTSVDEMWLLNDGLNKNKENIKIFAGASRKKNDSDIYTINNIKYSKSEHLEQLKKMELNEKAIVLHYDTLSEGINIQGLTGVMFLTDTINPISTSKMFQNIGRGTRIITIDRNNLNSGYINLDNIEGWIKPYMYIILPVYDTKSEMIQKYLAEKIKKIGCSNDILNFVVTIGNDKGKNNNNNIKNQIHEDMIDVKKVFVEKIEHRIEELNTIETNDLYDNMDVDEYDKLVENIDDIDDYNKITEEYKTKSKNVIFHKN